MTDTDVAIIGGGLAGSTTAAMLGRAGVRTMLVDPHPVYPPDLRCEKLDSGQVSILGKTGLADAILPATTFDGDTRDDKFWVARFGRLIDKRPGGQYGIRYDDLVNVMRVAIPPSVACIAAKAVRLTTGDDHQQVSLSNGSRISARLVVLAHGLSVALKDQVGIARIVTSPCHSITIAFDLKPRHARAFDFAALTYYPERAADQMAYLTLFPIGMSMRANLMVYRTMDDPWLREMRRDPERSLLNLMPNLARLTGDIEVVGSIKIRPADLCVSLGHRQAGIVLVGDAFATSCPAAGTGAGKVFNDVERLCNIHIPSWLASRGMGADKIAQFYDDPVKRAYDEVSMSWAYRLRSMSVEEGFTWNFQRRLRFIVGAAIGAACQLGVIPIADQLTPEGWTQRLRNRT
ncbi:NAD(P)/FAD-dependent oxidoreductase [Bradyrhizobium sp. SSUT18]|uniref:FAD-dependent oxidoreductase n=1 Tax=unclassified Bradyrhizobium TaxID=2631580 RepID=UPI00244CBEFA|nr:MULTISPECIES: NAD(P)/FAD-dependent oxidoreductase [unclassified Bradyrhizobium]MDH2351422.1 NAD(P)/FAD-dependent oxidoreductase [Bradyrhizobium sp. SSUT112]MDH2406655.1 NAD(P)/FAD-dependent oxidoreductase [Bradyrhizobium sp. SSUT18]